jgi:glycosyltransferase involved in cell wall biosynthesis
MNKLSVLIININNLKYTRDCINDLLNQNNENFIITLIDQGSKEKGTKEYIESIKNHNRIKVINNKENVSINKLWNDFKENEDSEYLCYLNNDIRLTDNFIDDTISILDKNEDVGIVIHSTNSWKFNKKLNNLQYKFSERKIKQGFDFTIRKKYYVNIPETLKFYFGDDWLFHHIYEINKKVAICISSPIIHYGSKSSNYASKNFLEEENEYNKLGLKRELPHYNEYSEIVPTFKNFNDKPIKTMVVLGMHRSATSLIAKSLNNEIYMGDDFIIPEIDDNPEGHFENINFVKLNDDILKEANGHWSVVPPKENILNVSQYIKDKIKIRVAIEINKAIEKGYKIWGWEDPRTVLTIPLYLEHLPNPHFVSVFRKQDDVVESLVKRGGITKEQGIKLTKDYNLRLIEFLFEWNIKNSY